MRERDIAPECAKTAGPMSESPHAAAPFSALTATWGVLGVGLLLMQAVVRLTPVALEPLVQGGLTTGQAMVYAAWVVTSLYAEGYRGFQKAFVPRTVARAFHLARTGRPLLMALAPVYCMGLIHATRRRMITSWTIVLAIALAVVFVRRLPAPWRGVVDGGVVAGLLYGVVALALEFRRALRGAVPAYPLDLPGKTTGR
jgi:hypothetical protein